MFTYDSCLFPTVGDSGYALEPWLITPVPGNPPARTHEGRYNAEHTKMRSVVERTIGILKSRFRCLHRYRTLMYNPIRSSNIVTACAILHNVCLYCGIREPDSDDHDSDGEDDTEEPWQPQRALYVRGAALRNGIISQLGTL